MLVHFYSRTFAFAADVSAVGVEVVVVDVVVVSLS